MLWLSIAGPKDEQLPIAVLPNAGQPRSGAHGVEYPLAPSWFRDRMADLCAAGAAIIGGCCGVAPAHIAALAEVLPELRVGSAAPTSETGRGSSDQKWWSLRQWPSHRALREALWASDSSSDELLFFASLPGNIPVGSEYEIVAALPGIAAGRLIHRSPAVSRVPCWQPALAGHDETMLTIDGFSPPAQAIEQARLATRLGLSAVVIDAGVFAAGDHHRDPLQLGRALRQLALGIDAAGNSTGLPAPWALGVRLPMSELPRLQHWQNDVGIDFLTLQPIYSPQDFRQAMATIADVAPSVPVIAEVLVLPDAMTAAELNHERPAIRVPEQLLTRLQENPDLDRDGVVTFLRYWRRQLSGVMLVLPDGRPTAAAAVFAGGSKLMPHVLITGASGGIGAACMRVFHAAGWRVSGLARRADELSAVVVRMLTRRSRRWSSR